MPQRSQTLQSGKIWGCRLGWKRTLVETREASIDQPGSKPGGTLPSAPNTDPIRSRLHSSSSPFLSRSSGALQVIAVTSTFLQVLWGMLCACYVWVLHVCHAVRHSWLGSSRGQLHPPEMPGWCSPALEHRDSHTALEAGSLKSRCRQGHTPL